MSKLVLRDGDFRGRAPLGCCDQLVLLLRQGQAFGCLSEEYDLRLFEVSSRIYIACQLLNLRAEIDHSFYAPSSISTRLR